MTKDVRREEMSKFSALSGCTYNDEISTRRHRLHDSVCHKPGGYNESRT